MTTFNELRLNVMNMNIEANPIGGRWLITGGLGFIGRYLIGQLLDNPAISIKVLDNESVGKPSDLNNLCDVDSLQASDQRAGEWPGKGSKRIIHVKGDIRHMDDVRSVIEGADVIIHLAANTGVEPSIEDPVYDVESNVIGTFNVFNAVRESADNAASPHIVFASSNAPLGAVELPASEKSPVRPLSPYGASKLAGEGYVSAFAESFGLNTVALRFGNVYGPGSLHKGSVVAKFIRRSVNGQSLEIYGDGQQSRDFIYIGDLVKAIIKAATTINVAGETFQISPGTETCIADITDNICNILESRGVERPDIIFGEKRKGDMQKNYSDVSKARIHLGWEAQMPLTDGLETTIDWFLAQ